MKEYLQKILYFFKIDEKYLGYQYLIDSVTILSEHPDYLRHITKGLYPEIAKKYKTNVNCVERNIRTIIEVIWQRGGYDYFYKKGNFAIEDKKRPTNTQFFIILYENTKLKNNVELSRDSETDCHRNCQAVIDLKERLAFLEMENQRLRNTILRLQKIAETINE